MEWNIIDIAIIAFETWLYYWYFSDIFSFRCRGIKRWILILVFPTVTYLIQHMIAFNSAKTSILLITGVVLIYTIYKCTLLQSLIWNSFFVFLLIVSESIAMGFLSVIHGNDALNVFLEHSFLRLQCLALSKVINVVLIAVSLKLIKKSGRRKYTWKEVAVLLLQAFSSILCLMMIVELGYYGDNHYSWSMLFLIMLGIGLLFSYLISYYFTNLYFAYRDREEEILLVKMRNEKIIDGYQRLENSQQKVYQLYHDLKKHLNAISMMEDNGEVQSYLEKCFESVQDMEGKFQTGNRYIDMFLYDEWRKAYEIGINVQFIVEKDSLTNVSLYDVIIILGNALENAREACEKKLEQEDSAYIQMKIVKNTNQIFIVVSNNYIGKIIKKKDVFLTNKNDKELHGIGIKSIQSAVEKYQGKINVSAKDDKFILVIMLNI